MKVSILKHTIKNFKGIETLTLDLQGKDWEILGENGAGKTTIYDSFLWVLYGKDSENQTKFNISNINSPEKETIVETQLKIEKEFEQQITTLKKVYAPQYINKKTELEPIFKGYKTDYYINDEPVKEKDYKEYLYINIETEENIKTISNVKHFNENLKWKERRNLLLEMCPEISKEKIIEKNNLLKDIKNTNNIDSYKATVQAKIKELKNSTKEIPIKIDTYKSQLKKDINFDVVENEIIKLKSELKETDTSKINELKSKMSKIRCEGEEKYINKKREYQIVINDIIKNLDISKEMLKTHEYKLNHFHNMWKEERQRERRYKDKIKELKNMDNDGNYCPVCKQELDDTKLKEEINMWKAEEIKSFEKKKENARKMKTTYVNNKDDIRIKIEDTKENIKTLNELIKAKTKERDNFLEEIKNKYNNILYDINEQIKNYEEENKNNNNEQFIKDRIKELETLLFNKEQNKILEKEIEILKEEHKKIAIQYEEYNKELDLIDLYIKTKIEILEETINNMFKYANFMLFQKLVNGDIAECCETIYKNVPYSDLNNSMRYNIGIDIINTISKHKNIYFPIFIDNKESISNLFKADNNQIISLVVSKYHTNIFLKEV